MSDRIRILIITDSPGLPTGLAETTRLIFGNLITKYPDHYDLHQIGLSHFYAVTTALWPVHQTMMREDSEGKLEFLPEDNHGQKTFFRLQPELRPDIVFAFGDPQNVLHFCLPPNERSYKLILHVNFDGLPMPPGFGSLLDRADLIFTKSEFSRDVIALWLPRPPHAKIDYMYSPADLERFAPASATAKAEMRRDLFPAWMPQDAFVLGWIGRNQWRKQVWVMYRLLHYLRSGEYLLCGDCGRVTTFDWDPVRQSSLDQIPRALESRPGFRYDKCSHCNSAAIEKARPLLDLFLWCHMAEDPKGDWPLLLLEHQFGLRRDRDLCYTPEHELKSALPPDDVPMLYKLWDALLFLSGGEGFGLPAWEAMCSGLPVVYTNYSAHGEFLTRAGAGLSVGGILQPESKSCIWRMIADMPQAIEAVRRLYFDRALGRQLGANGRAFVSQFTVDRQVEVWHRIFQQVMNTQKL